MKKINMSGNIYMQKKTHLIRLYKSMANSGDPDEMPHMAAFHQGLHCKGKIVLQTKEYNVFLKTII